ncbi:hypothetical protein [Desulfosporosinus sp. FKB]|uniref:hypothetical protein n=1 Tax=Desulfosporosinus sp. FKB TaxID=1969835 RepID=UPI000B4A1C48|nr:hypothetical protein [Desulfosporosinus sp. FKB]
MNHNGEKAGLPRTIRNAEEGKICLYTTCFPNEPEINRVIFGLFRISEVNQVDADYSGNLKADKSLRIALSKKELLNFWDYYNNTNSPENGQWGSGLFRYLDDVTVAQILLDIQKRASWRNKRIVKKMSAEFCSEAGLDCTSLPLPNGYRIRHGLK